ncbi:MAG: xanthine dehydrogenase family protein subunit M [Bryobacteraceae bacterium]
MKSFRNINPKSLTEAARALQDPKAMVAGGGSDLLGMIKEHIVAPDTLVNLRAISGIDTIARRGNTLHVGGLATIDSVSDHAEIRQRYAVLAEAAGQVATPQIRNVGTIAGNLMQRPWCWYFRNNFPCYKNGGTTCFSITGENEFHAIFGGGPSFIVHPSDTAPALVALNARFRIVGPQREREVAAADFFQLPTVNPAKENALASGEVLAEVILPEPKANTRSTYVKVLDRESWTHAVVSVAAVLEMNGAECRSARIVLGGVAPIPWRVPAAEAILQSKSLTEALLVQAAEKALEGARPLAKNAYKIPLTKATVKQALRAASGLRA